MQLSKLLMFPKDHTRTGADIETEVENLDGLFGRVPDKTALGNSNRAAIRAARNVLILRLTLEQAVAEYEDGDPYVLSAALDAMAWLCGNGPAPSIDWAALGTA